MRSIDDTLAWKAEGVCAEVDPELFFPERGGSTVYAKKLCASCDVRERCLEYSIATREPWGVWGGLSERQRTREIARREAEAKEAREGTVPTDALTEAA